MRLGKGSCVLKQALKVSTLEIKARSAREKTTKSLTQTESRTRMAVA